MENPEAILKKLKAHKATSLAYNTSLPALTLLEEWSVKVY